MDKNYLIDGNFRKILIRLIDDPFGKTKITDLGDVIPFENENEEEIFIEDGRCFVRHNNVFVTYFYVDGEYLSNYELIKIILIKHNICLNGNDARSKEHFIEEIKAILKKQK